MEGIFVKSLEEIKEPNVSEIGGKGYSLAVLTNNGFDVPKGFVITSNAFFEYLKYNNLLDKIKNLVAEINEDNFKDKSWKIRDLILNGKIPRNIVSEIAEGLKNLNVKYVSVRSSAVSEDSLRVSFAGMHDTFLNVKAELELVLENVKKCWASLFSERAVIYRMKKGVLRLEGMAVIVQEMIPAEVSGVTFTLHPLNKNALLIESARGLGDLIVSGKIIPDYFVINRKTLSILEKRINEKTPSLSDSDVKKIAKICLKVEKIFINPQDIEWCIFDNRIWLLQSRAITTNSMIVKESLKKKIILKGIGASPGIAQGKVKIVLNPGEVHKMKEGDILVTVMTNPLYVTAIQKAKAIITDIGGMICHAAIVARELGIPCVVGTKNATKVLKDNMEVVVNGTEGKVYASS